MSPHTKRDLFMQPQTKKKKMQPSTLYTLNTRKNSRKKKKFFYIYTDPAICSTHKKRDLFMQPEMTVYNPKL